MLIKELVSSDKPRERAKEFGFKTLTTTELVALIIRSGTKHYSAIDVASSILKQAKSLETLQNYSISKLNKIYGMGDAKSTSLLAAIELASRLNNFTQTQLKVKINSPSDIFKYMSKYNFNEKQEEFYIICLNVRREVIASKLLFKGTIDSSLIHPREIFNYVLECSASYIVLAHNHPSRNLTPSNEDISVTKKLVECGQILSVNVLDHIVFSDIDYFSLKENQLM